MDEKPEGYVDRSITPEQVEAWVAEMRARKLARSAAACAVLLNISANAVGKMRKRGADRRTGLAFAALLAGLKPYGQP